MNLDILNVTAKVDYANELYAVSAVVATGVLSSDADWTTAPGGWLGDVPYKQLMTPTTMVGTIINSYGELLGQVQMEATSVFHSELITGSNQAPNLVTFYGAVPIGINNMSTAGIDPSYHSSSELLCGNPYAEYSGYVSTWTASNTPKVINQTPFFPEYTQYYWSVDSENVPVRYPVQHYVGTPIQFNDGGGVLNAYVSTQVSGNRIRWTNPTISSPTADYTNALVTSIGGSQSGGTARVTSYNHSMNEFTLDTSGNFSGNYISVAPLRTVSSYSGWHFIKKPRYRFVLDKSYDKGIGDLTGNAQFISYSEPSIYTQFNFGGGLDSTPLPGESAPWALTGVAIAVPIDTYGRYPTAGDILYVHDYNNAAGAMSGLLVVGLGSTAVANHFTVECIPRIRPAGAPYNNFLLNRCTSFDVQAVPKFGEELTVKVATDTNAGATTIGSTFKAPTAQLQITANDYDSVYGNVTSTSHFHVGPVHLSDGTVLTNTNLHFSGSLKNGNPLVSTSLGSWNMHGSQQPNIGQNFSGMYAKDGVFVMNYNQAFTTPDVISLTAEVGLYSAKVKAVATLAVQPPV